MLFVKWSDYFTFNEFMEWLSEMGVFDEIALLDMGVAYSCVKEVYETGYVVSPV